MTVLLFPFSHREGDHNRLAADRVGQEPRSPLAALPAVPGDDGAPAHHVGPVGLLPAVQRSRAGGPEEPRGRRRM